MPNFNYKAATDREFFRKWAHLQYIRQEEADRELSLATIGLKKRR